MELGGFGGADERERRAVGVEGGGDAVEVAGAHLPLVFGRGVAARLRRELGLLQFDVRAHLAVAISGCEFEHPVVEGVEAGKGDELERVAHRAQLALESRDLVVVEVALPVEAGRAVVRQLLVGELRMDALRKGARELDVRLARLHPEHVGVWRVCVATGEDRAKAVLDVVEALGGAGSRQEGSVALVVVTGQQRGGQGIRPRDDDARHAGDVGGEPSGIEGTDVLARGNQHLSAHVSALLLTGELVLPVHTGGSGLDHRAHQLVGVEWAPEARLGVGDDGRHPVNGFAA